MGWGPRLKEQETVSSAQAFTSLDFLAVNVLYPVKLFREIACVKHVEY